MQILLFILLALGLNQLCLAQEFENLGQINTKIHSFISSQLDDYTNINQTKISVGKLDDRLKLRKCSQNLNISIQSGSINKSRLTTKVSCEDNPSWRISIPVKIEHFKEIYVAATNIRRGDKIDISDLILYPTDINKLSHSYYTDMDEIKSMVAKRNIRKGSVIKPSQLSLEKIIQRGQLIKIIAKVPGMQVESNGEAMQAGSRGEIIPVKNVKSKRIVEGIVISHNSVEVAL